MIWYDDKLINDDWNAFYECYTQRQQMSKYCYDEKTGSTKGKIDPITDIVGMNYWNITFYIS